MKQRRAIVLFNLFSFFNQLDFYVPIKVVYFHLLTGSYATASTVISVVWVAQALCEIPTGVFSDLIGRKRTIVLGSVLSLGAYVLYAWNGGHLFLLLGSALEGGSRALFSGNNNAYLHNLLSAEQKEGAYQHYYGRLNGLIGVAMVVAALGSTLLLQGSPHLFMWINVLPQLVTLVCALLLTEVRRGDAERNSRPVPSP